VKLSADACGVIATLVPVYLLVLHVGGERLTRHPESWGERWVRWGKGESIVQVLLLTAVEVACLYGLATDGLSGLAGSVALWSTIGLAGGTGLQIARRILLGRDD